MGLGDFTEKAIHAIVPDSIIKSVQGKEGGCGCAKRKEALNTFSYNLSKALSLTSKTKTMNELELVELEKLSLAELRIKYPDVKSNSKDGFIEKVKLLELTEENIQDSLSDDEPLDLEADYVTHANLAEYVQSISKSKKKVLIQCVNSIEADAAFAGLARDVFPKLDVTILANSARRDVSLNGSCYLRLVCQTNYPIVVKLTKFTEFKDLV